MSPIVGTSLLVLSILFLSLVFLFVVYDIAVALFKLPTISWRIQTFIQNNPALSILEGAIIGFLIGLFIHFQVETWNYYIVAIIATAIGTGLGVVIWRVRKPGVPV